MMSEAARREANLTLKLDPQDAGAYVVLSEIEPPGNYAAQEAILLRGIKFARHPKQPVGALYQYEGGLLNDVGRLREGLSYQLVAQATDEWSASKTSRLAFVYANMGNLAAARSLLQKAMERWPNHSSVLGYQRYVAGFYEQPAEAIGVFNRLDARASPGDDQNGIWRSFVEARAAHSGRDDRRGYRSNPRSCRSGKIPRETEIMMIAGLGETKQAIEAANLALDRQRVGTQVPVHAGHARRSAGPGFRRPGLPHGRDQILAGDGQAARLLHRPVEPRRVQPAVVGRAEIDDGALLRSGPEIHGDAGENIAAKSIVQFGIAIAVDQPGCGRGVSDDQRRLPIQDIVRAQAQLESLPDPEGRRGIEIVLRLEAPCWRSLRYSSVRISDRAPRASRLRYAATGRTGKTQVACSTSLAARVLPARLNVARLAEQAGAIVRPRKPAIVDDPLEHVAAAKFEVCRAHAAERRANSSRRDRCREPGNRRCSPGGRRHGRSRARATRSDRGGCGCRKQDRRLRCSVSMMVCAPIFAMAPFSLMSHQSIVELKPGRKRGSRTIPALRVVAVSGCSSFVAADDRVIGEAGRRWLTT